MLNMIPNNIMKVQIIMHIVFKMKQLQQSKQGTNSSKQQLITGNSNK